MRYALASFVALVAAVVCVGASGAALPPAKLYHALLTEQIATSQVPPGLAPSAPVDAGRTATMAKYAGSKAVLLQFETTELPKFDPSAEILYEIYPSHRDALAEARAAAASRPNVTATRKAPSWVPKPATIVDASADPKKQSDGITDVSFVDGDVTVDAVTISSTSGTHGNLALAFALARLALRHLAAARA